MQNDGVCDMSARKPIYENEPSVLGLVPSVHKAEILVGNPIPLGTSSVVTIYVGLQFLRPETSQYH